MDGQKPVVLYLLNMNGPKLSFDNELTSSLNRNSYAKTSKMTTFIKKYSFGLIQTDQQADIFKVVVLLFSLVWFAYVFFSQTASTFELPSDELINSPQPVFGQ